MPKIHSQNWPEIEFLQNERRYNQVNREFKKSVVVVALDRRITDTRLRDNMIWTDDAKIFLVVIGETLNEKENWLFQSRGYNTLLIFSRKGVFICYVNYAKTLLIIC